jgi:glutamate racemase
MNNQAIGVIDSGIGGLTVVSQLFKFLSNEKIIYLGDTARVPYGGRSEKVINQFSLELVDFLVKKKIKALVIACNSISANSLSLIKKNISIPIIDVINPTADFINNNIPTCRDKKILIIGTKATVKSKIYLKKIKSNFLKQQACPLLVPIAEENLINDQVAEYMIKKYLSSFEFDCLVLGCTHYPLFINKFKKIFKNTKIISSGEPMAKALEKILIDKKITSNLKNPKHEFYLTDISKETVAVAKNFLGKPLPAKLKKAIL